MINWKVRFKNKAFWIAAIPAVLLLVRQIAALFGFEIDLSGIADQLVEIVGTIFFLLTLMGIVVDPTTKGVSDSDNALTYDEPQ